ncbi:malate:quinone oxidoreductase [Prochlorococcus sp. MIT 1300]|uniref:malate:quinone oxidoreductase n=1 Tax=Prochlorococcus sp. MIT 1300 TaxID=3096218 RepID=UPI002A762B93|nr:malate:quinone oxidoreductase [Prochlorococcus sp. MIT 1300]
MTLSGSADVEGRYDAILVGAGIMSATLASLLNELDSSLRILIVERLEGPALESTAAVNNAGTGHAANCELNYTPSTANGKISTEKAVAINLAFEQSLEYWGSLVSEGKLSPKEFLNVLPHISAVWGDEEVAFLRRRYEKLKSMTAFSKMEWSIDRAQLNQWMPLVMEGRNNDQAVAATRVKRGTDVDFGALTRGFLKSLQKTGALELKYGFEVVNIRRLEKRSWELELQSKQQSSLVQTPFVFLGAGGGTLPLLQKSGIPEAESYAGFPVSGQWLVCSNPELVDRHHAKVYGKAKVGAPPMSVPHLDTRWIGGKRSLLFGPYAGFSSKFLKKGSHLDLFRSLRVSNLSSMIKVGLNNFDLVTYLITQLSQTDEDRLTELKGFFPKASAKDWNLSIAGQRVQIIKRTKEGSLLKMGTEVVSSSDGSLAALLGASPGASTAVSIMLEVLRLCWGDGMLSEDWKKRLAELIPSYGKSPNLDSNLLVRMRERSNSLLGLS